MAEAMKKDALVCERCEEVVTLCSRYEGLVAECDCTYNSMAMKAGSGEKPRSWKTVSQLKELKSFRIDGGEWGEDGMVGQTAKCMHCGNEADAEFEDVSIGKLERKVTLRCDNSEEHPWDEEITETGYNDMGMYTSDFWK